MSTPGEHATAFMNRLFGRATGFIDVKVMNPVCRNDVGKQYFDVRWPADAIDYAFDMNAWGYSTYCGVNPRRHRAGEEKDVLCIQALFLDLDLKRGVDIQRNLEKLQHFGLDPSMIVWSGNGAHFYLILDEPLPVDEGKLLAERLCNATESDRVFNATRIARIPGTLNFKTDPPNVCYLTGLSDRNYSADEVSCALDRMGVPHVAPKPDAAPTMMTNTDEDPLFDWFKVKDRLPPQTIDLIEFGIKHEHHVSRSESDYEVVRDLVVAGVTDAQIHTIYSTMPIGTLKYRKAGIRYLNQTIKRARLDTSAPVKLRRPAFARTRFGRSCRTSPLSASR